MDKNMMPYPKDKESKEFIGHKIGKMMEEGRAKSQGVAIALEMARKRKKR